MAKVSVEEESLRVKLYNEGWSDSFIGKATNREHSTITRWRQRRGLPCIYTKYFRTGLRQRKLEG